MRLFKLACFVLLCGTAGPVAAESHDIAGELAALKAALAKLEVKVQQQSQKIDNLQSENLKLRQQAPLATDLPKPEVSPVVSPARSLASSLPFVPEIGVVGDLVALSSESKEDAEGNDRLSVRELELVMGADVDPYTRFDATIAFSDFEEVHLEEAYATFFGLPADFKLRMGRLRPKLGRTSPKHRDSLLTVDEPLMIQQYFGVEGLSRTGVEVANFLPLPWDAVTHELTLGVMEGGIGEGGTLFGATSRQLSFYSRLRNAWEISDMTDFELGASYMLGSSDEDSSREVHGYGVDVVLNHHLNPIQRLRFEAEALFQNRSEAALAETGHAHEEELEVEEEHEESEETSFRRSPWGMYALADVRFAQRWSSGIRWDYVQPVNFGAEDVRSADTGTALYLTFHQSEFARWRLQYERVLFAEEGEDNRFFLQGTFAIGTHKHMLE